MAARSTVETRRIASPALRTLMSRRTAELTALALGVLGLALLVALASYDPRDPSLNTATDRHPTNLAGTVGAGLADILLQGFGMAGVLPGMVLLAWAWRIGSHRGLGSMAARLAAMIAAVPVVAAMLAASLPHAIAWPTTAGPGGAIGSLLAHAALGGGNSLLGPFGAVAAWMGGAALAIVLTLGSLGLQKAEWRIAGRFAGRFARYSWTGGRGAAGMLARGAHRMGTASGSLSQFLRREPGMDAPAPGSIVHREPRGTSAGTPPEPDAPVPSPSVRTVRKPGPRPAGPQQQPLPLPDASWRFPPLSLLKPAPARAASGPSEEALQANARLLETVLSDYGVQGSIVEIRPGPVVTLYELEPAPGIRSARVIGLADDVARIAVGDGGAHRHRPRPQRDRHRGAERQAGDRVSQRVARFGRGAEEPWPAGAGAGQGHRRHGDRRRPVAHAASDDRGHHRLGQVGRRQRDDPVAAVSAVARPVPADPDRPEDAGAFNLRQHPASDGAGGDGAGQGGHRTEMDRAGDGAAVSRHEPARGAQPDRLQRPRHPGSGEGRGGNAPRADRLRSRHRPADLRGCAAGAGAAAADRGGGGRDGRPDDGGRARRSSRRCSGWRRWRARRASM